jgi:hypothetical protein
MVIGPISNSFFIQMNTYPFDENGVRDAIKSLHIFMNILGFFFLLNLVILKIR